MTAAGTFLRVLLTVLVVGGIAAVATNRVADRTEPSRNTEDGAVVEPIFESPTPSASAEATMSAPTRRPAVHATETPFVTPEPTEMETETPYETEHETEEPTDTPEPSVTDEHQWYR